MNIVSVKAEGYKSIHCATLDNCGQFNVLIGKNNSGKSNLLLAIDVFFSCLKDGGVLTLEPPVSAPIDFHQNDASKDIEITLLFQLTPADRTELLANMTGDAPQMKYAVDSLASDLWLSIALIVSSRPTPFAYISKVALRSSNTLNSPQETIILKIGRKAAEEIYATFSTILAKNQQIKEIQSSLAIGEDVWQNMRSEETSSRTNPRYLFGRRGMPPASSYSGRIILTSIQESSSFSGFKEAISSHISNLENEVKSAQESLLSNKVTTFAGDADTLPGYIHQLVKQISQTRFLRLKDQRKQIGVEEAARLLSLKVTRGGPEQLSNIQQTVSALLGVRVDAFQGEEAGDAFDETSTAELDVDNFLVEVNGSGVREALRLILDVEFQKPRILLVEEPEIHLHPALEISMMRYLKRISGTTQVFITTHSTNFLDTGEMKNVYLISKGDSTDAQLLNIVEAEEQIPSELGIRLSSLFMFDRLIFVEGMSDEAIVREFASTLEVNLSQANVGFVHMGGVRNFAHFAVEATLSFLKRRQVKMWFLMDRDERDEPEISKIKDKAGANATVQVLERREIENYLLSQRALTQFINLKAGRDVATEEEVHSALEEQAEHLKQMSIDKRVAKSLCEPIYPNRHRLFDVKEATMFKERLTQELQLMMTSLQEATSKIDEVYEHQSKVVEDGWQKKKFELVPGYELLDNVCKKFSLRFHKEQDGARLAALMQRSEIDPRLAEVIASIVL